jgi:hypothetical protein
MLCQIRRPDSSRRSIAGADVPARAVSALEPAFCEAIDLP